MTRLADMNAAMRRKGAIAGRFVQKYHLFMIHEQREIMNRKLPPGSSEAFAALFRGAGVQADAGQPEPGNDEFPVTLQRGATCYVRHAIWKSLVRSATALALVHARLNARAQGLLVTTYLSPYLSDRCRQIGLQFIDTAGNAYLEGEGLYIYVSGRRPEAVMRATRTRGTGNSTALRMIFALVSRPALLQATYREIAQASGVALGAVGTVFRELAERGWLLEDPATRHRRLTAPERMLDEWVANYPSILRPRLQVGRFAAPDPGWWRAAEMDSELAYWSGEVAAEKMTGYLQAEMQTVYVDTRYKSTFLKHMMQKYRLRQQPDGPIEILDAFWPSTLGDTTPSGIAPPLAVYADLMASLSSRNIEVASMLRKGVLQHAIDQF
ncbi:type IV toxin-antitoxin system AbiEi family antitoxin [Cupriavidus oxalaticus]|uniref:type IV toxin-antitoxin system AbiEi family antitoxin n=1 Tax=Cupriavidus oxalaticus TaxID=96344 RepID=UPI003F73E708